MQRIVRQLGGDMLRAQTNEATASSSEAAAESSVAHAAKRKLGDTNHRDSVRLQQLLLELAAIAEAVEYQELQDL